MLEKCYIHTYSRRVSMYVYSMNPLLLRADRARKRSFFLRKDNIWASLWSSTMKYLRVWPNPPFIYINYQPILLHNLRTPLANKPTNFENGHIAVDCLYFYELNFKKSANFAAFAPMFSHLSFTSKNNRKRKIRETIFNFFYFRPPK